MKSKLDVYLDTVDKSDKEPALKTGITTGTVAGILSIAAFIFPTFMNERQTTIVLVISAFVLPIATAILTRRKTWSIASVEEVIDEAVKNAEDVMKDKMKPPESATGQKPAPKLFGK